MRILIGLAIVTGLGGCASLVGGGNERSRSPQVYFLDLPAKYADETVAVHNTVPCMTLLVRPPVVAPGFQTSRMAYIKEPYRLDFFAYSQWADTLSRMLQPMFVRALEQQGMFKTVAATSSSVRGDFRLETEELKLQQVFHQNSSEIQLSLRAHLFDLDNRQLLASQRFAITQPATESSPTGGVQAANQATSVLLDEILGFVERSADFRKCSQTDASAQEE